MNTVVIYKSKTGFTKRYAQWIAEELSCDILEEKKATANTLKDYNVIIFGGGIMAGQIGGLKKVKSIVKSVGNTKLVVFATGATPAEATKVIDDIRNTNLSEQERNEIPFFYFHSGMNYDAMSMGGKMMMKMFTSILDKKKSKTSEEQGMLDTIKGSCDYTKKEYVDPLVAYVRGLK